MNFLRWIDTYAHIYSFFHVVFRWGDEKYKQETSASTTSASSAGSSGGGGSTGDSGAAAKAKAKAMAAMGRSASSTPAWMSEMMGLEEETGLTCMVCHEGYKFKVRMWTGGKQETYSTSCLHCTYVLMSS